MTQAEIIAPVSREPAFRADIDGLRALAIGAVLLFHFDFLGAGGGFAGVDIFFVISGFLMTGMLTRARAAPVTLVSFYKRRFWRIAPAYYVTIAVTLAYGAATMLAPDVERLGISAVAASLFAPNFFFATGVGYFDTASIYKPLLHTWSLGVEMQFYLVWPFVVMLIARLRPARWALAFGAICALSFVACSVLSITDSKAAFFSLPARLWEFGLGGLVAIDDRVGLAARLKPRAPAIMWIALAGIVATPWLVNESDPWPGPLALPACLGTALIILLGGGAKAAPVRFLSSAPMTFLGRISYSLYLVHWPVVCFVSYAYFSTAPALQRTIALACCLPLAMLLYRYVETPLRAYGRAPRLAPRRAAFLALVPALMIGFGYWAHRDPARFGDTPPRLARALAPLDGFICAPWRSPGVSRDFCLIGDRAAKPTALLWGDSHAMHLVPGFEALLRARGGSLVIAAKDACPPIAGLNRVSSAFVRRDDCRSANEDVMTAMADPDIRTVILASRWAFYGDTTRFGMEKGGPAFLVSAQESDLSIATTRRLFETKLDDQARALAVLGKRVIIVAQTPEMGFDAWRCVVGHMARDGALAGCDQPRAVVDARQAFVDGALARVAAHSGARVVDPKTILCDDSACHGALDGEPAYRDDNHLGAAASVAVVKRLFGDVAF